MMIQRRTIAIASVGTVAVILLLFILLQPVVRSKERAVVRGEFENRYLEAVENLDRVLARLEQSSAGIPYKIIKAPEPDSAMTPREAAVEQKLVLQGVSYSREMAIAMINGRNFREGDQVGGYKLEKVTPYGAMLKRDDGTELTLQLKAKEVP